MKKLPEVNCLLKIWIIVIIVLNPMAVFSTNIHGSTFKTNSYVSGELYEGGFAIAKNGQLSSILVDETDYSGVKKVAGHLQSDIKLVTGKEPVIVYDTTGIKADYVIIIGTIGKSALINALIERGKIKVDDVQGKWETSLIQVVDHPFPGIGKGLIIAGSDKRGTIFGMFDLSAQIGVSPWNWWADVPDEPRVTGGVTKNVARLFLAKSYLTYAWWLENPNNVPTYPEATRQDLDGHDAAWYHQQAYNVALDGITNPGPYGLQETFYDLHAGANERNKEMMLYADHTEASEFYNASSLSWSNGGAPENFAVWFVTCNYTLVRSSKSSTWADGEDVSSVQREAAQAYGRPWTRMAPTIGAIKNTFADKTLDSRFDATFVSSYRGNWAKGGVAEATLYNANGLPVSNGDAILTFLGEDNAAVVYPTQTDDRTKPGFDYSNVGAGIIAGRADFVIEPSAISRLRYPGLWKMGTYRTDSGAGLGQPNGALTRPFYIAKFSEFYFIAAEAAVKGATVQAGYSARELINVIRARAGKWSWDNNGNVEKVEDNSAAMIAATPATITIDYILAERSREYFGEGYRWYDLIRTQKWEELASTYQIAGAGRLDYQAQTINRTIEKYHYLRPIPQGQLDGMEMSEAEKAAYQNPGYN